MHQSEDVLTRLVEATNRHDLEGLVACFADDYRLETPSHPSRTFQGREQVRRNWEQIFAGVPDIEVETLRTAVEGEVVWSEWEMRGTRRDGGRHLMRGPIIFGVGNGLIAWGRFYVEPVDETATPIDEAVRAHIHSS